MQIKLLVPGLVLAAAIAFTPAALAGKPPKPVKPAAGTAVTIDAKPSIIVFSGVTTLSGRLSGGGASGVGVRLEQDDSAPYGDGYKPASNPATKTSNSGAYSFAVKPLLKTYYRVVAQTSPPVTSPAKLVSVRMLVGIKVSDATPRRGALVSFSGSVFPAHDGRTVSIQKRSSSGRFVTVLRTALRDAGDTKSTYGRRVRISRDGVYRVKVAGDADHANGLSRTRSIAVHG